ncbi:hypothetical protein ACQ10A_15975, partial [Enterococcus faecalis]|uniref:hypothetical protein n=1 Tax=Enterococcus faecalis TaxID=1351 RepID=UPI003D6BE008
AQNGPYGIVTQSLMISEGRLQLVDCIIGEEVRLDFSFENASTQSLVHTKGASLERRLHKGH